MRHAGEQEDQEGAGPGAVESVIGPDHESDRHREKQGFQRRQFLSRIVKILPAEKQVKRRKRQNDQHDALKQLRVHQQRQMRPDVRPDQRRDHAGHGLLPGDEMRPGQAERGHACAHGRAQLVGGDGVVNRQARDHVGRQRDQPAAAGDRVNKAAEKDQRTDDQICQKPGRCEHEEHLILSLFGRHSLWEQCISV